MTSSSLIPMPEDMKETASSLLVRKQKIIDDSPSRHDGISYELEKQLKVTGAETILDICQKVYPDKEQPLMIGWAAFLLQKFFAKHSSKKLEPKMIGMACLAIVSEEPPCANISFEKILAAFCANEDPRGQSKESNPLKVRKALAKIVKDYPSWSTTTTVHLPYKNLAKITIQLRGNSAERIKIRNAAHTLATVILLYIDWSVHISAPTMAFVALHLAFVFLKLDWAEYIPQKLYDNWWNVDNRTMKMSTFSAISAEIMKEIDDNWDFFSHMASKINPSVNLQRLDSPKGVTSQIRQDQELMDMLNDRKGIVKSSKKGLNLRDTNSHKRPSEKEVPAKGSKRHCLK